MKWLFPFCFLFAGLTQACTSGCHAAAVNVQYAGRDSLLTVLDRTVENKARYIAVRQHRIDSLEVAFARETDTERKLKIGRRIYDLYFDFQNDRALEHIGKMQQLAARIAGSRPEYLQLVKIRRVALLRFMGYLKESSELLDQVGRSRLTSEAYPAYIVERMMNNVFMFNNNSHSGNRAYYDAMAETYRDTVLMLFSREQNVIVQAERFMKRKQHREALLVLHEAYDRLDPCSKRAGTLAYNIALCYEALSKEELRAESERYLILSAISDLRHGVRGYKSLPRLAERMYEAGDIDRAYSYMKCAMEDIINCSARIRTQEVSEMFVVINEAYQLQTSKQRQRVSNLLIVIGSVCMLLLLLLIFIGYQYFQLASVRQKLSDANLTKEGYMGVFIESYSRHLARMNAYRLKSVKLLKAGNLSEIEAFVDRALNMTDDQEELHRKFDAAILSIFPTFVEEYNALMKEQERICVKGKLTIEQRIAAYIRLGITDSDKIALFLRYSIRTVYNYRSQMRSKAKNPKDFEKELAHIGLIRPFSQSRWRRVGAIFGFRRGKRFT